MKSNFKPSLELVGLSEGGYTAHPYDRGNWYKGRLIGTNHGISAPVLARWWGRTPTKAEMMALSKDEAGRIFKARFWDTVRADDLPVGLDYAVFDYSVNSGPGRAIRALQGVAGTYVDGIFGPLTLRAVHGHHVKTLINRLMDSRLSFLKRLRGRNGWPTFGRGWSRRVSRVRRDAISMAND